MSSVYNLEPPTKGKVTLKTTLGDIDIELWPKEAPKLCMEGYYGGTVFHRVIKDFMIQGGDPTGTGRGGESIYGDYFKDEFHTRLKFNHRGVVACANENEPHTNGSQFFITLDSCPHLDRKHTIFGKVVGDSIYNVAHFNELNVDSDDRPLELPRLLDADILWNPFEDIVPRITKEEREAEATAKREQEAKAKAQQMKKKKKKNLGLLSFGEEAGDENEGNGEVSHTVKMKSVFDTDMEDPRLLKSGTEAAEALAAQEAAEEAERKQKKAKLKAQLLREAPEPADNLEGEREAPGNGAGLDDEDMEEEDFAERMRAKAQAQRSKHGQAIPIVEQDNSDESESNGKKRKGLKSTRDRQQEALASGRIKHAHVQPSKLLAQQDLNLMSDFERKRREAKERSKLAKDKGNNFAKLMTFKKRLATGPGTSHAAVVSKAMPDARKPKRQVDEEEPDVNLPAAWRIDRFLDNYEDEKLDSLATHKLEFIKVNPKSDAMATNFDDNYKVEDPLLERQEQWDKKTGAEKRRKREWATNLEAPTD